MAEILKSVKSEIHPGRNVRSRISSSAKPLSAGKKFASLQSRGFLQKAADRLKKYLVKFGLKFETLPHTGT